MYILYFWRKLEVLSWVHIVYFRSKTGTWCVADANKSDCLFLSNKSFEWTKLDLFFFIEPFRNIRRFPVLLPAVALLQKKKLASHGVNSNNPVLAQKLIFQHETAENVRASHISPTKNWQIFLLFSFVLPVNVIIHCIPPTCNNRRRAPCFRLITLFPARALPYPFRVCWSVLDHDPLLVRTSGSVSLCPRYYRDSTWLHQVKLGQPSVKPSLKQNLPFTKMLFLAAWKENTNFQYQADMGYIQWCYPPLTQETKIPKLQSIFFGSIANFNQVHYTLVSLSCR